MLKIINNFTLIFLFCLSKPVHKFAFTGIYKLCHQFDVKQISNIGTNFQYWYYLINISNKYQISGGSRGGSGGSSENPSPPPVFKYPMKMSETKLFHFHGIFKKHEIKSAKQTPLPLYI